MNSNPNLTPRPWLEGDAISPSELVLRYEIPREEIASFHQFIRVYPYGGTLIREGDTDKSLYLLRSGTLAILKQSGAEQREIATIEAVNFVGEMSLINEEPRNATVQVTSDQALVYVLARPNFNLILSNPKWAEMLISRLSKNLAHNNTQLVATTALIQELRAENVRLHGELEQQQAESQRLVKNLEQALDAVLFFENMIVGFAVTGSRGWAYLKALVDVTRTLVAHYLPQTRLTEEAADPKVVQECLKIVQQARPSSIYDKLFDSL
jgi:CRP-like cAMP-binding protein